MFIISFELFKNSFFTYVIFYIWLDSLGKVQKDLILKFIYLFSIDSIDFYLFFYACL